MEPVTREVTFVQVLEIAQDHRYKSIKLARRHQRSGDRSYDTGRRRLAQANHGGYRVA
jgi:hypothetical protein